MGEVFHFHITYSYIKFKELYTFIWWLQEEDIRQELRIANKVIEEYKEENGSLLNALIRIDKAIDHQKLNDRFGHTQQYVREAIKKAQE